MTRTYYLLVSAAVGAAVLAVEVAAVRAMAPALGSGPVAWSSLLSVALAAMAVGNLSGGVLSRQAPCGIIAWSLAAASAYLLALSQFYRPAMLWSGDCPLLAGAIAAAAIAQAVPLALLSMVAPAILPPWRNRHRPLGGARFGGRKQRRDRRGADRGPRLPARPGPGAILLGVGGDAGAGRNAGRLAAAAMAGCRRPSDFAGAGGRLLARHDADAAVQSDYGQLEIREVPTARILLIDGLPQTALPAHLGPGDGLRYGYLLEAGC